jgi:hypothetical protein
MRPYRVLLRGQGVFFAAQSSADCITSMAGFDLRQAQEYAFTELGCTLDDPVGALLAWTAANTGAVRRSQAEFDRSHRMDDAA